MLDSLQKLCLGQAWGRFACKSPRQLRKERGRSRQHVLQKAFQVSSVPSKTAGGRADRVAFPKNKSAKKLKGRSFSQEQGD